MANFFWSQNPDLTYRQVGALSGGLLICIKQHCVAKAQPDLIVICCMQARGRGVHRTRLLPFFGPILTAPPSYLEKSECISKLLQVAVACIHTDDGRITLTDKRLRVFKDALVDEKELGSDAEVEEALSTHFGITL